ncbi:peptidoglycan DD-metalloendopeptidase family protein [Brevibacillus sp. SYSU BS000544]|uniref:peptidoglycan DD-metalloendopeptidase family protein n=1 Tax=Brevibacillus sp. SYSU BS000544 TaxID=3416443 RepID=UPI003CE52A2D
MQPADWKAWLTQRVKPLIRRGSQQTRQFAQNVWSYVGTHKKQASAITAAILLTASIGGLSTYYYQSNVHTVYHVIVNGKEIGVVDSQDVINKWAEAKLKEEQAKHNGLTLTLSDYITYTEETRFKPDFDNTHAIAELSKIADIKVQAVKIVVNGQIVGYAPDQATADAVLNSLKQRFGGVEPKQKSAVAASVDVIAKGEPTKQVKFKEDVKTVSDAVPAAQVLTKDKLEELLQKGTLKQVVHTVQQGDCIGCIAEKYGIRSKDIYANNPGVTENTVLQLGQTINVTALKPLVTVQVEEEVVQSETIPYTEQSRTNSSMPKGDSKVLQQGKEGTKKVRYKIVKENGQMVDRVVLNQQILSQPVAKIVERGTKVIPSRGTGRFMWPARGYISSGFGKRWGRMHQGIDIAGSGSIRAADNGRVVQAGWNGNYGKSVIIDHGNGVQTLYGHMRSVSVDVGDVVAKGKTIGIMGSTGDSTGVHLHFEVRKGGHSQNPIRFLR